MRQMKILIANFGPFFLSPKYLPFPPYLLAQILTSESLCKKAGSIVHKNQWATYNPPPKHYFKQQEGNNMEQTINAEGAALVSKQQKGKLTLVRILQLSGRKSKILSKK